MPYQLHCDAQVLLAELATELFELDEGALLGVDELTTELITELFELDDVVATELFELDEVVATELEVTVEHTLPVMVGFSAALPFLSPCTPKLIDCPGWIVLFQSNAVAVYGLLPLRVAFHELVILLAVYCQPTVQPLIAVEPLLVIVMEPWKPVFHSLATE